MVSYSRWFSFLFLLANQVHAQPRLADSVKSNAAIEFARQLYFSQRGEELPIYNGVQRDDYSQIIQGTAFFQSPEWKLGSVVYDQVVYDNILMRYDLVTDQLQITRPAGAGIGIALFSPRIRQFSFSGFQFIRISGQDENAVVPGFYQQLVSGSVIALERRSKKVFGQTNVSSFDQSFKESIHYYLSRNGNYFLIEKKGDMLAALKDHRKEVQQFLTKNKMKFRKDPEKTLVAVAQFYNHSGFQ